MAAKEASPVGGPTLASVADRLAQLEETCSVTLHLVKSVVALLMPKTDGDGQALAELIAIMIGLQRDHGQLLRLTQADTERILSLLPAALNGAAGHQTGTGRPLPS